MKSWVSRCGPGIISGTANDDPSCLMSYSVAGAGFGVATLWLSLYTLPLVVGAQVMFSRLALVTGRGLAGDVRAYQPRWVLWILCALLAIANIATIGADLGGMAEVSQMVLGGPVTLWTIGYAALILGLLFWLPYNQIERVLRWLCLVLFAYVAAAVLVQPDWGEALRATLVPRVEWSREFLAVIVAILGATLSPYFLFWQASQEIENEMCRGRRTVLQRQADTARAPETKLERPLAGAITGSVAAKIITYAVTLTAAATLFARGQKEIQTARDAAAALEPAAGAAATWLFALGIVGTGLLAVPVLAGSCAYAISEAMAWRASLEEKPRLAPKFYGVLAVAVAVGVGLLWAGLNVVQMLFWASVLNGLLAPVTVLLALLLTRNPAVMGDRVNPGWISALGWVSVLVTGAAALALVASMMMG